MSVMAKATWEGIVLAESNQTIEVEGNHYFPPDSIRSEFFRPTDHHTLCIWKGTASYYDLEVNGKRNPGARGFTQNRSRPRRKSRITSLSGAA